MRSNFKLNRVTSAAVIAITAMTPAHRAVAGPGMGDAYDLNNNPFIIQSYFPSSPAGARLWTGITPVTGADTGAIDPLTGAPAGYDPANRLAYAAAVAKMFPGGYPGTGKALRKFVDPLPLLGAANVKVLADGITQKYIPVAVPTKWVKPDGTISGDDYYEIAVVEYAERLHTDLKKATTLRGYVQIDHIASSGLVGATTAAGKVLAVVPGSKALPLYYPNTSGKVVFAPTDVIPADATPILINKVDANGKLVIDVATGKTVQVQALVVDAPHYLGPIITATSTNPTSINGTAFSPALPGAPTRIKYLNLLPVGRAETIASTVQEWDPATLQFVGKAGLTVKLDPATNLPLRHGDVMAPVDPSVPGSGFGPDGLHTYPQNRTTLHLHGGDSPWISDGGPHTWITPAGEADPAMPGSVASLNAEPAAGPMDPTLVPEFLRGPGALNVPDMYDPGPGAMTYYFPNGQSSRMEWYHDHTVGITRLNVAVGMASAYLLTDATEQKLIADKVIPGPDATIPLVLQEKTFVPDDIAWQDARWDVNAWGGPGDFWYSHVYETVQDPNQATNFNSVGRWHWGPWFYPSYPSAYALPSGAYGDVTLTPENWLDTPVINGVAYPTMTVEPKPYRFKILNASNDRTFTFNFFLADASVQAPVLDDVTGLPTGATRANTEVKMIPVQAWKNLCAPGITKSTNGCTPDIWSTDVYGHNGGVPDPATQGPTIFQIGSEGGLLPGVAIKDATPVSYLLDKGRQAVLNVEFGKTGLHLGNAERADIVVDFSKYAGQTLIVYNDSGAPVPAADPRNEYFTGYGDNSATGGSEDTRPGYGPNTRTMMQIVVGNTVTTPGIAPLETADPAVQKTSTAFVNFDKAIKAAYKNAQEPPVVAQSAYNGALGTAWTDAKAFAQITTGSLKEPAFTFTPGNPKIWNSILVSSTGSGYTRPPIVALNGGGGTGATAKASLKIEKISVVNPGSGYKVGPLVTVVSNGNGNGAGATATLKVTGVQITAAGTGYTSAPTVTFGKPTTPGGVPATGTAVITAGKLTGVTITNPGSGYSSAPTAIVTLGGGTGAKLTTTGSVDNFKLDVPDPLIPSSAGGGGYDDLSTAASEPNNPAPGLLITVTAPPAGGVAATAAATGKVFDITPTNYGKNYTSAPGVAITPSAAEPVYAAVANANANYTPLNVAVVTAIAAADTNGGGAAQGSLLVKNKAIQELFDPTYGRLNATFGVEIPFTSALTQTTIPLGYVDAPTEEFADGETQIWKITHNGVDSHPIHFHLMNVQLINRVGWDNFISPPEANELGWKETVKMSPLEDVIVAVHAKKPPLPGFGVPASYRLLDPSQPEGAMTGFTQIDAVTGLPATMVNAWQDFGWEYVWHCHILGHEENDFMRPIVFHSMDSVPTAPAIGTAAPDVASGGIKVTWTDPTPASYVDPLTGKTVVPSLDDPTSEIGFRVERAAVVNGVTGAFTPVGTVNTLPGNGGTLVRVNALANATSLIDAPAPLGDVAYRVVAANAAGESAASASVGVVTAPLPASGLVVTSQTATTANFSWVDNSTNETAFMLGWTNGVTAGNVTYAANTTIGAAAGLAPNTPYTAFVTAVNAVGNGPSNTVAFTTAPVAATGLSGTSVLAGATSTVTLAWTNGNPNLGTLTSVVISGTVGGTAIAPISLTGAAIAAAGSQALTGLALGAAYSLTVTVNGVGGAAAATTTGTTAGSITLAAATGATAQLVSGPVVTASFAVQWVDASVGETGYQTQICFGSATQCTAASAVNATTYPGATALANRWYPVPAANVAYTAPVGATGAASAIVSGLALQTGTPRYYFRVAPLNVAALGPVSNIATAINLTAAPAAPTVVTAVSNTAGTALVSWTDNANNNASTTVQARRTGGVAGITLGTGGTRYTVAPTVTIGAPAAGGVRAVAHAVVSPLTLFGGGVVSIVIDNPGTGYTARPAVSVTGGTRQILGLPASGTGTANANLGLGNTTWVTPYATVTTTPTPVVGNLASATATGLTTGQAYQFQVQAVGITNVTSAFVNTGAGVVLVK